MISLSTISSFILINDIQKDLLLEHVQAHLENDLEYHLSISNRKKTAYSALSWKSTGLDYKILISNYVLLILQDTQISCLGEVFTQSYF